MRCPGIPYARILLSITDHVDVVPVITVLGKFLHASSVQRYDSDTILCRLARTIAVEDNLVNCHISTQQMLYLSKQRIRCNKDAC
jgi:hypothetical protein